MKKFTINCDFNGQMAPFTIAVGKPEPGHHPLFFQADWLSKQKGGIIPQQVMDAVSKLKALSDENNVSFEELCVYALGSAQQNQLNKTASETNTDNTTNVNNDDDDKSSDNNQAN